MYEFTTELQIFRVNKNEDKKFGTSTMRNFLWQHIKSGFLKGFIWSA